MTSVRRKSARRVLVIALAAAAAAAGVLATFQYHRHAADERLAGERVRALGLVDAGDLDAAAAALATYLRDRPADADALVALGRARLAAASPTRDALFDARARLQQALSVAPDRRDAQLALLDAFGRLGYAAESLTLADQILAASPAEAVALRARAEALVRLNRPAEAAKAWRAYVARRPDDVGAQVRLVTAARRAGDDAAQTVEAARSLSASHGDQPAFALPLAQALHEAGRDAEAVGALAPLVDVPPANDAALLTDLVNLLDRCRAYREADAALSRASATSAKTSPAVAAALVARLWQAGRHADVVAATDARPTDRAAAAPSAATLAFRALSLRALGRDADARRAFTDLSAVAKDEASLAWVDALSVEFDPAIRGDAAAQLAALRRAVTRDASNGVALAWLGRALTAAGELDAAAACYESAARLMPSWPAPPAEWAATLLAAGRTTDAVAAARSAFDRAPESPATLSLVARVRYADVLARPDAAEERALRAFADQFAERLPGDLSLASVRVALAGRAGDADRATQLLDAALAAAATPADFEALDAAATAARLDAAARIYDAAAARQAISPRLTFERGAALLAAGRVSDARRLAAEALSSHPNSNAWSVTAARLLAGAGDAPAAARAWQAALASTPVDPAVQLAAILEAKPVLGEGAWRQQAVDRIRAAVGEESVAWRIAQATVLLDVGRNDDERRQSVAIAGELVRRLPARGDLRALLARGLMAIGNEGGAVEQSRAAADVAPADAQAGLALAAILRQTGRPADADAALSRLANFDQPEPAARRAVAQALLDAGRAAQAVALFERPKVPPTDETSRVLYASALDAAGRRDRAAAEFAAIASREAHPTPAALGAAAAFARRSGDDALAAVRLAAIGQSDADPAARAIAAARYHAAFGEVDAARAAFAAAADDVGAAREAVAFELSVGATERARAIATRFADDPSLRGTAGELAARTAIATVGSASTRPSESATGPSLAPLVAALAASPERRAEADAIAALEAARIAGRPTPELARQLGRLAAQYPTSIELAAAAIEAQLSVGDAAAAKALAGRLAGGGADARSLAVAATTFSRLGLWREAADAATRWNDAAPNVPAAVATLARARLELADPAGAVALLTPAERQLADDARLTLARARVAVGSADVAFAVLRPTLANSAATRAIWLALLDGCAAEEATARLSEAVGAGSPRDAAEATRLATACLALADRTDDVAIASQGAATFASWAAAPDALARSRVLYADLLRAAGRTGEAEQSLRATLAALPEDPATKNALAYLLLTGGRGTEEARRVAREAAQAAPRDAAILDTLARCERVAGDPRAAEARFREALRLRPGMLDARLGLASLLASRGDRSAADAITQELAAKGRSASMPARLKRELAGLSGEVSTAR